MGKFLYPLPYWKYLGTFRTIFQHLLPRYSHIYSVLHCKILRVFIFGHL